MSEWWKKHKNKVYIGLAITVIAVVPLGSFLIGGIYLKMKNGEKEEDES